MAKYLAIEKLEMIMQNQQITSATLSGSINFEVTGKPKIPISKEIVIQDPRWEDKSKFQHTL